MGGKIREQQRARKLRAQGLSLLQISEKLMVAKSSVSYWVRTVPLGNKQREMIKQREREGAQRGRKKARRYWQEYRKYHPKPEPDRALQKNLLQIKAFFSEWSNEMAYVLGYFAADGCMYHSPNAGYSTGGYYVVFYSTDLELIETVKRLINIRNKIECDPRKPPEKKKYILRIVNKGLYGRFLQLSMSPRKSLDLKLPPVPNKYVAHFVRGYFDGDGHVYIGKYKRSNRSKMHQALQTGFTSGSRTFLEELYKRLRSVAGVREGSLICRSNRHYVLQFSTNSSRQLYNFMYPSTTVPCLSRKRAKFERGIKLKERSRGPMA